MDKEEKRVLTIIGIVILFVIVLSAFVPKAYIIRLEDGHQYVRSSETIIHAEGCDHSTHNN